MGLVAPLAQTESTPELTPGSTPGATPGRIALLRALDKVDGRTQTLRVQVGQTVRYGWLDITVHHCESTPPTEQSPESFVFLEVVERMDDSSPGPTPGAETAVEPESAPAASSAAEAQAQAQAEAPSGVLSAAPPPAVEAASRLLFSGWMFASSPALNPLEHSIWDVWVLACLDGPGGPDSRDGETAS